MKSAIPGDKNIAYQTPPYNPLSNIVERWHLTLVSILRAMGPEMGVKAACLAYNTTVHTSRGQTPFFAMFGCKATLPVNWIYPVPCPWTDTVWDEVIRVQHLLHYCVRVEEPNQRTNLTNKPINQRSISQ